MIKNTKLLINASMFVIISMILVTPLISFGQPKTKDIPGDTETRTGHIPADKTANQSKKLFNPLGSDGPSDIPGFIKGILIGALKIGVPVVALAIIYSGFLFVFAMGNSEKLKKAKDALMYSLIGAAILLGSWAIAELIVSTIKGIS